MARGVQGLRRDERLRRAADFQRVLRQGVRVEGRVLSLVGARGPSGRLRLGLAASRRLGGAVVRNRAKRLLRESFRRHARDLPFDVVALPKAAVRTCGLAQVEQEYGRLLSQLKRRLMAVRHGDAPSAAH